MNFKVIKIFTDIGRTLNNPSILLKILTVWAAVSLTVVGFGIISQFRLLVINISTYPKMKEINKLLESRAGEIGIEYNKVEQNRAGVALLNTYLPDGYGIQNYIVDLSFATAKSGFQLNTLFVQGSVGFEVGVIAAADFSGDGNLGDLVSSVESLKRVSQVSKLKFTTSAGERRTSLDLNIYSLGANE